MIKQGVILLLVLFLVGFATAGLGSIAQDECISIRVLANCTEELNLSEVSNSNETFIINSAMTNIAGQTYNYTFCNTNKIGTYAFSWDNPCVDCATYGCGNSFEVTYDGTILNMQSAVLYIGLIFILIFFFLLIVFNIHKLPSGDTYNEDNILLGINNLKYLRSILWMVSWGLLLGIMFIVSNISLAYLPETLFGDFFFMIFRIMMLISFPMVIIYFLYLIAKLFRDKELRELIDRGVEMRGKP